MLIESVRGRARHFWLASFKSEAGTCKTEYPRPGAFRTQFAP